MTANTLYLLICALVSIRCLTAHNTNPTVGILLFETSNLVDFQPMPLSSRGVIDAATIATITHFAPHWNLVFIPCNETYFDDIIDSVDAIYIPGEAANSNSGDASSSEHDKVKDLVTAARFRVPIFAECIGMQALIDARDPTYYNESKYDCKEFAEYRAWPGSSMTISEQLTTDTEDVNHIVLSALQDAFDGGNDDIFVVQEHTLCVAVDRVRRHRSIQDCSVYMEGRGTADAPHTFVGFVVCDENSATPHVGTAILPLNFAYEPAMWPVGPHERFDFMRARRLSRRLIGGLDSIMRNRGRFTRPRESLFESKRLLTLSHMRSQDSTVFPSLSGLAWFE